ncbi:N-6 DNA methylase [Candidatus Nomurabacteria bacterium RBG_16_40_11]|nr:MAG: N-6 DNA methylase [Candidatus Nomurabacteria bacterium RBG_16_40_11]
MLTQETKRKIDSARNILVGKVPDPKAQVEQITTALIYKFMDDMDKEAIELGGKARFFTKGFEKYAWTKLLDQKLGGHERLELYGEAVAKMSQTPHIPQLFRDIFKDAFLPYRSPETLTLFLKEINGFTYDHSEDLGNAFEYLLSILGSQGDAGQFRTPRHIIDFIAEVVDPKKGDTILDPACGTAGFLISAYKHILKQQKDRPLTPDEKKKLMNNLVGYDISPDMVKLSKVNMYLHGFAEPKIFEYDTLSSEEKWDEMYDVIMANPPFMSPSGGIRPHKRFSVQANRAEVLFVDYIKEHLRPNGRAGIIVPEGIIFKTDTASIQLRKILVEDGLWAVVSMPVGIFNPYSATIKTSILFFDTQKAKTEKELLFITIENDGYDLGAQRLKIDKNDLPEATELLNGWKLGKKHKSRLSMWVSKNDILKSGDYTLTLNRYAEKTDHSKVKFPIVKLQDICEIKTGRKNVNQGNPNGKYPFFTCAREHTFSDSYSFDTEAILIAGNGDVGVVKYYKGKFEAYQRTYVLLNFKGVVARYLYFILANSLREAVKKQKLGNTMAYIKLGMLQTYQIPLPPVEIQKNFITQIENEQRQIEANEKMIEKQKQNIRSKIAEVWGQ